jgi:hypothetical protein
MGSLLKALGLAGVAVAAYYFLEPSKGPERRQRFSKNAKDIYDNAGEELSRFGDELSSVVSDTVSKVTEVAKGLTDNVTRTVKVD